MEAVAVSPSERKELYDESKAEAVRNRERMLRELNAKPEGVAIPSEVASARDPAHSPARTPTPMRNLVEARSGVSAVHGREAHACGCILTEICRHSQVKVPAGLMHKLNRRHPGLMDKVGSVSKVLSRTPCSPQPRRSSMPCAMPAATASRHSSPFVNVSDDEVFAAAMVTGAQRAFEAELAALAAAATERVRNAGSPEGASAPASNGAHVSTTELVTDPDVSAAPNYLPNVSDASTCAISRQLRGELSGLLGDRLDAAYTRLLGAALGDGEDDDVLASGELRELLGERCLEIMPLLLKLIFVETTYKCEGKRHLSFQSVDIT